jgi:uncharacterized protein (DUF1499 family)
VRPFRAGHADDGLMGRSRLLGLLLGALALASCAMNDTAGDAPLEDPTSVMPSGKPNRYLLCPEGACAAPADGVSPTFEVPREQLEQAWLALMREQPRVEQLAEDPPRHLYLFRQRSALFRFPDLISVRFLDAAGGGSTLAIYSRSVYGTYDFGVNRRRVENWIGQLEVRLGGPARRR